MSKNCSKTTAQRPQQQELNFSRKVFPLTKSFTIVLQRYTIFELKLFNFETHHLHSAISMGAAPVRAPDGGACAAGHGAAVRQPPLRAPPPLGGPTRPGPWGPPEGQPRIVKGSPGPGYRRIYILENYVYEFDTKICGIQTQKSIMPQNIN